MKKVPSRGALTALALMAEATRAAAQTAPSV